MDTYTTFWDTFNPLVPNLNSLFKDIVVYHDDNTYVHNSNYILNHLEQIKSLNFSVLEKTLLYFSMTANNHAIQKFAHSYSKKFKYFGKKDLISNHKYIRFYPHFHRVPIYMAFEKGISILTDFMHYFNEHIHVYLEEKLPKYYLESIAVNDNNNFETLAIIQLKCLVKSSLFLPYQIRHLNIAIETFELEQKMKTPLSHQKIIKWKI